MSKNTKFVFGIVVLALLCSSIPAIAPLLFGIGNPVLDIGLLEYVWRVSAVVVKTAAAVGNAVVALELVGEGAGLRYTVIATRFQEIGEAIFRHSCGAGTIALSPRSAAGAGVDRAG